jgi:hypothetical protein
MFFRVEVRNKKVFEHHEEVSMKKRGVLVLLVCYGYQHCGRGGTKETAALSKVVLLEGHGNPVKVTYCARMSTHHR